MYNTPTIIGADFNCMPSSAMYELYSSGSVAGTHTDFQDQHENKKWEQRFSLQSAYSILNEPITNYTKDFKA